MPLPIYIIRFAEPVQCLANPFSTIIIRHLANLIVSHVCTGHALNKILKDFILKYELLQGKRARYVPGWDCHGLPIELKVLQAMNDEQRRELTTIKLRRKARDFALKAVNQQREGFKRCAAQIEKAASLMCPCWPAACLLVSTVACIVQTLCVGHCPATVQVSHAAHV